MNLFLDIIANQNSYSWISDQKKKTIKAALDKAVALTLNCQIIVNGEKTGWCQQHDHRTLTPVQARTFEPPAIASLETTSVIKFLMRIEKPSPDIIDAINSSVKWLERSKIFGLRVVSAKEDSVFSDYNSRRPDRKIVFDQTAPPIWTRFYEIETKRPFFCNRDGIKVYSLSKVTPERRRGYAWYGYWPAEVIYDSYKEWLKNLN